MTTVDAVRAQQVLVDGVLRPATLVLRDGLVLAVEDVDHPVAGEVLSVPDTAYVLPGVVDTHVHVNEPGRTEWEGFATATRAAARGGVTTLVDMPLNAVPPTTTVDHLRAKQRAAAGQLAIDVGFWGGAVPGNLADLEPLWAAGVFGFKCFLSPSGVDEFPALDPDQLHRALTEVARLGALMLVHAEDAAVLEVAPVTPGRAYADFLHSRPDAAETTAIRRLVDGCRETGARVHVVHLSSARALDVVAAAKAEGLPLTVETCPHYLCLAAESIPDGAAEFKCCPPIRDSANRDRLWDGLRDGVIDMVVSDHSPAPASEKGRGAGDLQQAWGGIAGLQVGFTAVAHEAGLRSVELADVSRWMSSATADLVGLTTKGRIAVGADADLAVYDPTVPLQVDARRLEHRHPISAYDGRTLDGSVTHTLVRGRLEPDHDWGRQLGRTSP